jgi:hypothetical protein
VVVPLVAHDGDVERGASLAVGEHNDEARHGNQSEAASISTTWYKMQACGWRRRGSGRRRERKGLESAMAATEQRGGGGEWGGADGAPTVRLAHPTRPQA